VNSQDWPYQFAIIDVGKLFVDESYQRPLTSFAKRIQRAFDPALVGTLIVSARDGDRYAIVDGQTRAAAVDELAKDGAVPGVLPCLVYQDLTPAQEADLFARLQKERRGIASYHRFRAAVVAGDPEAIDIQRIAREAGYEIGVGKTVISAVAALEKVYRRSPDTLARVLRIVRNAWGDTYMPNGEVLRGLAATLGRDGVKDDDRLAERLGAVTPDLLQRRASALREGMGHGGGSDKYMAGAMEGVYRTPVAARTAA
jgi:hypothetical protein